MIESLALYPLLRNFCKISADNSVENFVSIFPSNQWLAVIHSIDIFCWNLMVSWLAKCNYKFSNYFYYIRRKFYTGKNWKGHINVNIVYYRKYINFPLYIFFFFCFVALGRPRREKKIAVCSQMANTFIILCASFCADTSVVVRTTQRIAYIFIYC